MKKIFNLSFCVNTLLMVFMITLLTASAVMAVYCPYCGAENDDTFLFCASCGKSLNKARAFSGSSDNTAPEQADEYSLEGSRGQSSSNNTGQGTKASGQDTGQLSDMLKTLMNKTQTASPRDAKKPFASEEAEFLKSQGMGSLLSNPDPGQTQNLLESLNSNPQALKLFERYKDSSYQNSLLNSLKEVNEDNNPEMEKNIQMLEGLFNMLNSAGGDE